MSLLLLIFKETVLPVVEQEEILESGVVVSTPGFAKLLEMEHLGDDLGGKKVETLPLLPVKSSVLAIERGGYLKGKKLFLCHLFESYWK